MTIPLFNIKYSMKTPGKPLLGAIIAGIIGVLFALVGVLKTIMIIALIVAGYFIGSYLETRFHKDEED